MPRAAAWQSRARHAWLVPSGTRHRWLRGSASARSGAGARASRGTLAASRWGALVAVREERPQRDLARQRPQGPPIKPCGVAAGLVLLQYPLMAQLQAEQRREKAERVRSGDACSPDGFTHGRQAGRAPLARLCDGALRRRRDGGGCGGGDSLALCLGSGRRQRHCSGSAARRPAVQGGCKRGARSAAQRSVADGCAELRSR